MQRLIYALVISLALGPALGVTSGCSPASQESKDGAIKIGLYLPMTGSAAAMGQMVWEGVQTAHQLAPKVLGRPVKLVLVDTNSDKI